MSAIRARAVVDELQAQLTVDIPMLIVAAGSCVDRCRR
jgi:hypothetical protein